MRILYVLPYVPSLIRVRPYHFIRALAARHEVSVLAVAATPRERDDVDALTPLCRSVDVIPFDRLRGARNCVVAALKGEPLQAAICQSPALDRRLTHLLTSRSFDVIHVEHLRAAHLRTRIPDHVPSLFDAVDCISLLQARTLTQSASLRQRVVAALELRRTRAFERRLLRQFHHTTVTSPVDAVALQRLAPDARVSVIANGVDLSYFQPLTTPREADTLVFSGKMSYHANATAALHFVRHILPLVKRIVPAVRLRIVGSDPPLAIRALVEDPAISVTGYVPDVRRAIGSAAIAVCPVTVKAGIQNKILEAMAMGVPVVSTTAGAEGLAAQPGRDFLVAADPAEFATHVGALLTDTGRREQIGRAGREFVEGHHRWDQAAMQLEALYDEVRSLAGARREVRGDHGERTPSLTEGALVARSAAGSSG